MRLPAPRPLTILLLFSVCLLPLTAYREEALSASPGIRPAAAANLTARPAAGEVLTQGKQKPPPASETLPVFSALPPEEQRVVEKLRRFWRSESAEEQKRIVEEIEGASVYKPAKVRVWLHVAAEFPKLSPGLTERRVPIDRVQRDNDTVRPVAIRIPKGYSPDTPWPLLLAYHPTGGNGPGMIAMLEQRLGREIEHFVVAAPSNYRPTSIDSKRGISTEHRTVIQEMKKTVHVDSDRVYAVGFSGGGYLTWSVATFYAEEFAGAVPVGCTFDAAPEITGLWELLLPNVSNLPILHVWGARDGLQAFGFDLQTPQGAISELNLRVVALTKQMDLDIRNVRIPGGGHAFDPPLDSLLSLLEQRRVPYPSKVAHRFRHVHQAGASWLQGLRWDGDQWGLAPRNIETRPGEKPEQAIGRMIQELTGTLKGEIAGQEIRIEYTHLDQLALWIGDGMIDWDKPILVQANGQKVFESKVKRDLRLCLSEAKKTGDFDRLRWTKLVLNKAGEGRVASD
jgi:predicted esterase